MKAITTAASTSTAREVRANTTSTRPQTPVDRRCCIVVDAEIEWVVQVAQGVGSDRGEACMWPHLTPLDAERSVRGSGTSSHPESRVEMPHKLTFMFSMLAVATMTWPTASAFDGGGGCKSHIVQQAGGVYSLRCTSGCHIVGCSNVDVVVTIGGVEVAGFACACGDGGVPTGCCQVILLGGTNPPQPWTYGGSCKTQDVLCPPGNVCKPTSSGTEFPIVSEANCEN